MCWNATVSALFLLGHLLAAAVVHRKRPPHHQSCLLFIYFYASMELLQLGQWIYGDVGLCTTKNALFTSIAFLLIWLQPLLFSIIGRLSTSNPYYQFAFDFSIVTLVTALTNMVLSHVIGRAVNHPGSNFGPQTCTTVGRFGHLNWEFAVLSLNQHPSYFVYLGIILLCIRKYPAALKWTFGLGWLCTLAVAAFWTKNSPETPAFWCLLSVFADIPIVVYCFGTDER